MPGNEKNGHANGNGSHAGGLGRGTGLAGLEGAADELGDELGDDTDNTAEERETEPEVLEPAPPMIVELAAACVRFVQGKYGIMLDFHGDTLSLVDQYVRDARGEVTLLPSSLDLIAASIGAYLGETIRRTFGGYWDVPGGEVSGRGARGVQESAASADHTVFRLYLSHVYLATNPLGMGREALTMQEEDGWHAHLALDPKERTSVEQQLATLVEVPEDEYYLPSTRFDVVQAAYDALRARMEARGDADVRYVRKDYRS